MCIYVYKYTSHLASPFIPDAPTMGLRLKGKRQQTDGQIDPGFAPTHPYVLGVSEGGKEGAQVGV